MTGDALLHLDGVAKRFASPGRGAPAIEALQGVGFTLEPGRIMGTLAILKLSELPVTTRPNTSAVESSVHVQIGNRRGDSRNALFAALPS